eukprot:scaffold2270_cov31-Tisochrysis_lutea.AAC.2
MQGFTPLRYTATTIGASFLVKELTLGTQKITLQIWDTAGQERFRSMAPLYYRGAAAAIMVFSLNDATSFEKLKEWVRELMSNVEEQLVLAIAANKCDLADRAVPAETLKAYADSIGALLFETSAKSNHGVRNVVEAVWAHFTWHHRPLLLSRADKRAFPRGGKVPSLDTPQAKRYFYSTAARKPRPLRRSAGQ